MALATDATLDGTQTRADVPSIPATPIGERDGRRPGSGTLRFRQAGVVTGWPLDPGSCIASLLLTRIVSRATRTTDGAA